MVSLELPDLIPNQIGGADRPAHDGRTFAKVDPGHGDAAVPRGPVDADDVERAVAAAREAQPAWADLTSSSAATSCARSRS
jgi:aldehyde dehydrogenase (NAD+)